jgi:3-oxoacyl-[acyl-carrier protein] reductase
MPDQTKSDRAQEAPEMNQQPPFAGRVALVTGASGGIGRAIAEALAAEGAIVGLHYSSSPDPAHRLAEQIAARGGRSAVFSADLSDPEAPVALADGVAAALGPIELLVNNAGVGRRLTWEQTTIDNFDEAYSVNLRAPFLLTQRVLPTMLDRGFGRILFMSSVAGRTGGIVGPHYASAKAGLHGLTHFLAAQLAASHVTVNALAPALIADTGMLPGTPEEMVVRIPLGRLGTPEEVADLTLAVLRNAYVTNQVISIDGGMFPG